MNKTLNEFIAELQALQPEYGNLLVWFDADGTEMMPKTSINSDDEVVISF